MGALFPIHIWWRSPTHQPFCELKWWDSYGSHCRNMVSNTLACWPDFCFFALHFWPANCLERLCLQWFVSNTSPWACGHHVGLSSLVIQSSSNLSQPQVKSSTIGCCFQWCLELNQQRWNASEGSTGSPIKTHVIQNRVHEQAPVHYQQFVSQQLNLCTRDLIWTAERWLCVVQYKNYSTCAAWVRAQGRMWQRAYAFARAYVAIFIDFSARKRPQKTQGFGRFARQI